MKKTFTLFALTAAVSATAQVVTESFENDQLKTFISNNGTFFRDMLNGTSGYNIPKDQDAAAIYMMGLLAAGTDVNGQLKAAIGDYTQSDWFPGPIASDYNDPGYGSRYGFALWPMHKELIDDHLAHWQDAGYTPDPMLTSWPGNGNMMNGEAHYMAPFVDYDGDGYYNPADGDYPLIRGDHALFSILNDRKDVHPSGGDAIGLEAHLLFYLYDMPNNEVISQTTFMNITLINRGTQTLYDFRLGGLMDFDIGNYNDDYIGTMPQSDLAYGYNADLNDEDFFGNPGYGERPPAIGVTALNTDLETHVFITPNMYPTTASQFYNLLHAIDANGNQYLDDNGDPTNFVYTETELGWNEGMSGNPPGDRRTVFSLPPTTLLPYTTYCYDMAIVFGESFDGTIFNCVNNLAMNTADILSFYNQQDFACYQQVAGVEELSKEPLALYPNPAVDELVINGAKNVEFRIVTTDGKTVSQGTMNGEAIGISGLDAGCYMVVIGGRVGRFVKQ